MGKQSAIIVGAGDGVGAALARACLAAGFGVALLRRDAGRLESLVAGLGVPPGQVAAVPMDAADGDGLAGPLPDIEARLGPAALVIFNVAASYVRGPIQDLATEDFQAVARTSHAAFLTGRAAARAMLPRRAGTIIFTSSTASLRGGKANAALASARFAVRGLAESMARDLAPEGIHVALLVLDSMIDTPALRAAVPDAEARYGPDRLVRPDAVAEYCLRLHREPPCAWTHHAELRPRMAEW